MIDQKPTNFQRQILDEARFLRGLIITSYAQVEHLLGDIVWRCKDFNEYAEFPRNFPYKLETRVARVRAMAKVPGPLAHYSFEFEKIISGLDPYEDIRHFMAHGLLRLTVNGETWHTLEFRMYRADRLEPFREVVYTTNLPELRAVAEDIASHAQASVLLFRDVYLAHIERR